MTYKKMTGLDNVLNNLNKEVDKIIERTLAGLIRAAIIVIRDMEKTAPTVPRNLGNLRSSVFLVTDTGEVMMGADPGIAKITNKGPYIALGFSANYAAKVHEMVGARFKQGDGPERGAKFLERALDRNTKVILEMIQKEAQIKGK